MLIHKLKSLFLMSKLKTISFPNNFQSFLFSETVNKNKTKSKFDPHKSEIYKKVEPTLGKEPEAQPFPPFVNNVLEPRKGEYNVADVPNSIAFALRNNFPILRESVSAWYRVYNEKEGITYHVFNGARVPLGRILSYACFYLQGKNSPHYERNTYHNNDKIVITNASNIMLTGKKLKYKKYYKPSTIPGHLKIWTAKELLAKDPTKLIMYSLRGMLPKNKMRQLYMQNVIIFNGPGHNLQDKGLPQFGSVKPINFNEMFGMEITPKYHQVIVTPESDRATIEQKRKEGFEVIEDEDSMKRDFWKNEDYSRVFRRGAKKFSNKLIEKRIKEYQKVKLKGIRYI